MPSLYLAYTNDSACPYNRFLLPGRFCDRNFKDTDCRVDCGTDALMEGDKFDWIGFHSIISDQSIMALLKRRRADGTKLLWSIDDDWTSIPDWNPAKPNPDTLARYDACRMIADTLMVSTDELAEVMRKEVGCPVYSAPNLIDLTEFPSKFAHDGESYIVPPARFPIKVAWSGSQTHRGDIEEMEPYLHRVMEHLGPDEISLIFIGVMPPASLLKRYLHRGVVYQPQVSFAAYRQLMASIRPDVFLAPLAPVRFNESKSSLRVLESWAMNACPVASDFGPYRVVRHGIDGYKCDDEYGWFNALVEAVRDHSKRLNMALTGRLRLEAEFAWQSEKARQPWVEAFSEILKQ